MPVRPAHSGRHERLGALPVAGCAGCLVVEHTPEQPCPCPPALKHPLPSACPCAVQVGKGSNPSVANSFKAMLCLALCRGGLETRPVQLLRDVNGVLLPVGAPCMVRLWLCWRLWWDNGMLN